MVILFIYDVPGDLIILIWCEFNAKGSVEEYILGEGFDIAF